MTQEPQPPEEVGADNPAAASPWSSDNDQTPSSPLPAPPAPPAEQGPPGYPASEASLLPPPPAPSAPSAPPASQGLPAYQIPDVGQAAPTAMPQQGVPQPPYPPSAYPQAPAYPPAPAYPSGAAAGYPQTVPPGYPQAPGDGQAQAPWSVSAAPPAPLQPYYAETKAKASPTMGIVGVAIVLVSAIAGCVSTWMVGELIGEFLLVYDMSDFSTTMLSEPDQALFNTMLLPPMLASAVGIAGLVLSIIAVVKNKGRAWGVTGIVLGVLAPIAMFIMYVASVAAAVSAMLGG